MEELLLAFYYLVDVPEWITFEIIQGLVQVRKIIPKNLYTICEICYLIVQLLYYVSE